MENAHGGTHARIVIQEIWENLEDCDVCLADISLSNGNVYYEVGFAHAIRKPVVTIREEGADLLFDLSPIQAHNYAGDIEADQTTRESAINMLADTLEQALRDPSRFRPLETHPRMNPNVKNIILDLYFPAARMGLSDLLDEILLEKAAGACLDRGQLLQRFRDRIGEVRKPIRDLEINVTRLPHARSAMHVGQPAQVVTFLRDHVLASMVDMSDKLFELIVSSDSDVEIRRKVNSAIDAFQERERDTLEVSTNNMRYAFSDAAADAPDA